LNVFQSIELNTPVLVELAISIPNTPDTSLYVNGPSTEREVRDIFVASTPLSVLILPERVLTVELIPATVPERVARLELVVEREPESEERLLFVVARLLFVVEREPESEVILPVSPATVPDIAFCALVLVK
jgi:hypothetical protein